MSAVAEFQEDLLTLVAPVLEPEGVHCGPELPREVPRHPDRFYVIDETGYTLGGGEQFRLETFAGRFLIECFKSGDDVQAVKRRKWDLINMVDALLEEEDFMGYRTNGLVLSVESSTVATDAGWVARATCSIGVREEV